MFIRKCLLTLTVAILTSLIFFVKYNHQASTKYNQNAMKSEENFKKSLFSRTCKLPQEVSSECQGLFQGKEPDPDQIANSGRDQFNPCTLDKLIKDCSKLRTEHGYVDKPVLKEELDFPLAFSINILNDVYQVEKLLRTIYRPHNFYCIHVDAKASSQIYDLIKGVVDCLKNVKILSLRFDVVPSSIRQVAVEFACMKLCVDSGVNWRYYINLSEQEFVLRTNLELVHILKGFNGANDVEAYPLTDLHRIRTKFVIVHNTLKSIGPNTPFRYNITLYKGSGYGMFSREFVDFVLTDNFVMEFYQWLTTTYCPEETFWSTLNRLPFTPGGCSEFDIIHDAQTHASRAIIWINDPVPCHGKFVAGICILGINNLPWLYSSPKIVASRFREGDNSIALNCLEEWANGRTYSASLEEVNWNYYRNLPHVKYHKSLNNSQKINENLQEQKEVWLKEHGL